VLFLLFLAVAVVCFAAGWLMGGADVMLKLQDEIRRIEKL